MNKKRIAFLVIAFFCLLLHSRGFALAPVAVLDSEATLQYTPNPLFKQWEMEGVFETLKALHLSYQVLHDEDLTAGELSNYDLLILPNSKDISPRGIEAIQAFAKRGGKVFATGFASYRDNHDQSVGTNNNFQLSDLFGVDYLRYNTVPPAGGAIKLQSGGTVDLGRNSVIQVRPHPGTLMLGSWLNDDGVTRSFPETLDAAIVESKDKNSMYVGENLFAPENAHNIQVKSLIASLFHALVPSIEISEAVPFAGYPKLPEFGTLPLVGESRVKLDVGLPFTIGNGFITSESRFTVLDAEKQVVLSPRKDSMIAFTSDGHGFTVAGRRGPRFYFLARDLRYPLKVVLWHGKEDPGSTYKFAAFRDMLVLRLSAGKPILVNRLSLESYLSGVVSHEVPFHFHQEALKAMAIVARTFALKEMKAKKFADYDICATVQCQAYEGLAYEAPSSRTAVEATEGRTLTYEKRLADLPYYATCGGITEDVDQAWNLSPVPYLKSVVDGDEPIHDDLTTDSGVKNFLTKEHGSYCEESSRYRWKETYSETELVELFNASLPVLLKRPVHFSKINSVAVSGRTPHGRVTSLQIATDAESFTIGKDQIRWLFSGGQIGLGGLQSTLFVIDPKRDATGNLASLTILGGGWGHGVGLCQFGAEGMAERGFSYENILSHYFPGTSLVVP